MIKRITSAFLLVAFMTLFMGPLATEVKANSYQETSNGILNDNIMNISTQKIAATNGSTLQPNTPVTVSLKNNLSTSNIVSGGTVEFVVTENVAGADGNIVIQAGAPASAKISSAKSRKRIGKPGEVTLSDFHVVAVDGTYVPISGTINAKAKSKMALSITLSVLVFPLFLLMRGQDANIPAGTQRTFYTLTTTNINTARY